MKNSPQEELIKRRVAAGDDENGNGPAVVEPAQAINVRHNELGQKEGARMSTVAGTGNRARVRRYRALHRRIDYVPSYDVLPILEHYRKAGLDRWLSGVIDCLIRTGHQAITGNGRQ